MPKLSSLVLVVLLLSASACTWLSFPSPSPTPHPTLTPTTTLTPSPTVTPTHIPLSSPTSIPTDIVTTPTPTPGLTLSGDSIETALGKDEWETLRESLGNPPARPFDDTPVNAKPPRRVPNARRDFWVVDGETGNRRAITARLRVQEEHVAMWVEQGVWHDIREMEEAAEIFNRHIYSTTRAAFGSEWRPGIDNDPRVHLLHATGLGEHRPGYTSGADALPQENFGKSNEAELIVVNLDLVSPTSNAYYALLARELQRLIQWHQDRNEERWVKEGLAELSSALNGFNQPGSSPEAYLSHPNTSLTAWDWERDERHRGAAYLFATYFHQRLGDEGSRALTAEQTNGIVGFDATLEMLETDITFEELFADWLVTNLLDSEEGISRRRYEYEAFDLKQPQAIASYQDYPARLEGRVQQFGASYIRLQGDTDLEICFNGARQTSLIDIPPPSGDYVWWSNHADESLTTLTYRLDLPEAREAKLSYWTWYDIEPGYDYASVEISTDDGQQWQTLPTPSGTDEDPFGNNPGWGYTGKSEEWIEEEVDISHHAGDEVLIRFAYLTDGAVTGKGFMLDDISVPARDEGDNEEAAGFVHVPANVPQHYLALLIGLGDGDDVTIERLPIQPDQTAQWNVPLGSEGWSEAVLILSGLTPYTTQPAPYELVIE